MRIMLLGRRGQIGWELERAMHTVGAVTAFDSRELDITNFARLESTIRELQPDVILNAAGYTDVDRAESEADRALLVNATAPGVMAEAARRANAVMIHFSSDYVFDGLRGVPYTEADQPNPVNSYGRSKLAGERAIQTAGCSYLILRTSWVYSLRRSNFVTKVLESARTQKTMHVVVDQIGCPTWARLLADATAQVLAKGKPALSERAGLYHLAGAGQVSRFEWAKLIVQLDPRRPEQVVQECLEASAADFPGSARRPVLSALNCERCAAVLGVRLPFWSEALRQAMST